MIMRCDILHTDVKILYVYHMLTMCNMIFMIVSVIVLNRITPRETFIKKATIKMIVAKKIVRILFISQ
jgi:hypothetical protein